MKTTKKIGFLQCPQQRNVVEHKVHCMMMVMVTMKTFLIMVIMSMVMCWWWWQWQCVSCW